MSCSPVLDCQLTAIRAQAVTALVDSIIVKRKTALVADGAGGWKPASGDGWTTVATIDGLLTVSRRMPSEAQIASQIMAPVSYDVYVAHGSVVRAEDRLIIDSRMFECQGIAKAAAWAILDKLYCVELQK